MEECTGYLSLCPVECTTSILSIKKEYCWKYEGEMGIIKLREQNNNFQLQPAKKYDEVECGRGL